MTVPRGLAEGGLLSTAEVARICKKHRSTVWLWIKSGALKSTRVGAFHGVRPDDLREFLKVYKIAGATVPRTVAGAPKRRRNK